MHVSKHLMYFFFFCVYGVYAVGTKPSHNTLWLLKQPYSCTDPSKKKEKHILSWSSCQWIKRPRFESKLKVNEKGDCWYSSRKRNKQLLHTKLGPCKSAIQYITCNAYQFTIVTEQTFRTNNLCYHEITRYMAPNSDKFYLQHYIREH